MARFVHLEIERTDGGGALTAAVLLRVRGVVVLDWRLVELAPSALALARAATMDHAAGESPLFDDADFAVRHEGDSVSLAEFRGCAVAPETRFTVPWSALGGAALRLGDYTVRRSAAGTPEAWRDELRHRLRPIRLRRRGLMRAAGGEH
jgi:hypothetical protein